MKENYNHIPDLETRVYFQFFVKTPIWKSIIISVRVGDLVQDLKQKIQEQLDIPTKLRNLIYVGKSL